MSKPSTRTHSAKKKPVNSPTSRSQFDVTRCISFVCTREKNQSCAPFVGLHRLYSYSLLFLQFPTLNAHTTALAPFQSSALLHLRSPTPHYVQLIRIAFNIIYWFYVKCARSVCAYTMSMRTFRICYELIEWNFIHILIAFRFSFSGIRALPASSRLSPPIAAALAPSAGRA